MSLHADDSSTGDLTLDSDKVRGAAGHVAAVQLDWAGELHRRDIPLDPALFGAGLVPAARGLLDRVERGHQLRLGHARYLLNSAEGARALVDTIDGAEVDNAETFHAADLGGGR